MSDPVEMRADGPGLGAMGRGKLSMMHARCRVLTASTRRPMTTPAVYASPSTEARGTAVLPARDEREPEAHPK